MEILPIFMILSRPFLSFRQDPYARGGTTFTLEAQFYKEIEIPVNYLIPRRLRGVCMSRIRVVRCMNEV